MFNRFHTPLTFSGLLNALDGVAASEERLVFMTTNHIQLLDPALIRPGRVDVKFLIDNVSETQAREMFLKFYPGELQHADTFIANLKNINSEKKLSPAYLQGHFVLHRTSPKNASNLR